MVSPGLQNWSPVLEGKSEQGLGTGAQVLKRPGPVARRIFGEMRFQRGESWACVLWHKEAQLISSVHGDDFTTGGPKSEFDWFKRESEKKYD